MFMSIFLLMCLFADLKIYNISVRSSMYLHNFDLNNKIKEMHGHTYKRSGDMENFPGNMRECT